MPKFDFWHTVRNMRIAWGGHNLKKAYQKLLSDTSFGLKPNNSNNILRGADKSLRARRFEAAAKIEADLFIQNQKNASLVNIANIPSFSKNELSTTGKKHDTTIKKYRLLDHARKLLTNANIMTRRGNKHRTRTCSMYRARNTDAVTIKLNGNDLNSEASIINVQTCTCLWGCPICYEKKAVEAGEKILKAIEWSKQNNHFCIMVALTASHTREMSLEFSKSTFKEAWDTFNGHYAWKKFKKEYGVSHVINNVDITHGQANGWHYHKHLLLFFNEEKTNQAEAQAKADEIITEYWLRSLTLNDREANTERGAHVSDAKKSPSDYMAKIGLTVNDDGKLHYEMTSNKTKSSRNVWDILSHSRRGDNHSTYLYLEYVKAMTGDNWMSFGRTGLQQIIEDFEMPESDEPSKPKDKTNWLKFSEYWWDIVRWSDNGHARILDVAAKTRSVESIKELLDAMRYELMEANKLSEYYEKFIPIENSIADMRIHDDWSDAKRFEEITEEIGQT